MNKIQQVVFGFAVAIAGGYFLVTNSGPYKWLVDLQLRYLGWHEPEITIVVLVILIGAPFGMLFSLLQTEEFDEGSEPDAFTAEEVIALFNSYYGIYVFIIGAILLGMVLLHPNMHSPTDMLELLLLAGGLMVAGFFYHVFIERHSAE